MLNSTLHLNVFGRVNTVLIDKDSQCIYQLSRLSTLSHWSPPWSRGGGGGGRVGGGRTGSRQSGEIGQLLFKKSASAHTHTPTPTLCCNRVLAAASNTRSCFSAPCGAAVLQRFTRGNIRVQSFVSSYIHTRARVSPSFFMRCHGIPLKKRGLGWGGVGAQLAYYHLNNPSTCGSGPSGRRRENIAGIEGEWPLFIFQWTASGLHRPNPGTIHPETRTLPTPCLQRCSSLVHIHVSFLNPNINT